MTTPPPLAMALFAAARRAATCSTPLLHASVSRRGISLIRPLVVAAARPMPFSSATSMTPSSSEDLIRVTKSDLKLTGHLDNYDPDDEDEEEQGKIFTSYSDESLSSSDESSSLPSVDESSSSSVKNQEGEGEYHRGNCGVNQYKADDSSVKLRCTVYAQDKKIVINALALRPPPPWGEDSDGEPDFTASEEVIEFSQLDEDLQRALYKYLDFLDLDPVITKVSRNDRMRNPRARFWEHELWEFIYKED